MKDALVSKLDVDGSTDETYANDEIVKALEYAVVERFNYEFSSLTVDDVNGLGYMEGGTFVGLRVMKKRKLITFLACVHDASRKYGRLIDPSTLSKAVFNDYRVSKYDPKRGIVPYNVSEATSSGNTDLDYWKKGVKPTASSYKEFRDEAYWFRAKERFKTTLESQNLSHLIDGRHRVLNRELDKAQRQWLYKVFQDTMLAPAAKAIVTKHIVDKNCAAIWEEINEHYNKSMAGEMRAQTLSTYLTSTRLHQIRWRGNQTTFIIYWKEQARIHTDMASSPFTSQQLVSFLNACVSGTENLAQVYNLHMSSRKAANNRNPLDFEEYRALLIQAAQVHDASNTNKTNPGVPTAWKKKESIKNKCF